MLAWGGWWGGHAKLPQGQVGCSTCDPPSFSKNKMGWFCCAHRNDTNWHNNPTASGTTRSHLFWMVQPPICDGSNLISSLCFLFKLYNIFNGWPLPFLVNSFHPFWGCTESSRSTWWAKAFRLCTWLLGVVSWYVSPWILRESVGIYGNDAVFEQWIFLTGM